MTGTRTNGALVSSYLRPDSMAFPKRLPAMPCHDEPATQVPSNAICRLHSSQPIKFLQNLLSGIPQFFRQILPPRIFACFFEDTIWYQILPFVFVTLFEDLARRRCPCRRISPVVWRDEEEREAPVDQVTQEQRRKELNVSLCFVDSRMTINARTSQIIQKKTLPDMTLPGCIDITVMGIFSASNRRCNSAVQSTFASFVYAARTPFLLEQITRAGQENTLSP